MNAMSLMSSMLGRHATTLQRGYPRTRSPSPGGWCSDKGSGLTQSSPTDSKCWPRKYPWSSRKLLLLSVEQLSGLSLATSQLSSGGVPYYKALQIALSSLPTTPPPSLGCGSGEPSPSSTSSGLARNSEEAQHQNQIGSSLFGQDLVRSYLRFRFFNPKL